MSKHAGSLLTSESSVAHTGADAAIIVTDDDDAATVVDHHHPYVQYLQRLHHHRIAATTVRAAAPVADSSNKVRLQLQSLPDTIQCYIISWLSFDEHIRVAFTCRALQIIVVKRESFHLLHSSGNDHTTSASSSETQTKPNCEGTANELQQANTVNDTRTTVTITMTTTGTSHHVHYDIPTDWTLASDYPLGLYYDPSLHVHSSDGSSTRDIGNGNGNGNGNARSSRKWCRWPHDRIVSYLTRVDIIRFKCTSWSLYYTPPWSDTYDGKRPKKYGSQIVSDHTRNLARQRLIWLQQLVTMISTHQHQHTHHSNSHGLMVTSLSLPVWSSVNPFPVGVICGMGISLRELHVAHWSKLYTNTSGAWLRKYIHHLPHLTSLTIDRWTHDDDHLTINCDLPDDIHTEVTSLIPSQITSLCIHHLAMHDLAELPSWLISLSIGIYMIDEYDDRDASSRAAPAFPRLQQLRVHFSYHSSRRRMPDVPYLLHDLTANTATLYASASSSAVAAAEVEVEEAEEATAPLTTTTAAVLHSFHIEHTPPAFDDYELILDMLKQMAPLPCVHVVTIPQRLLDDVSDDYAYDTLHTLTRVFPAITHRTLQCRTIADI